MSENMKPMNSVYLKHRNRGVTLIELMIALVIMAILATVAYPSFLQSVRRGHRTDAFAALTRTTTNLERFFATNGTYTTSTALLQLTITGGVAYSDDGHYVMAVAAGPSGIGSSYVVTATATAGDTQADDVGCTVFSIDSVGRRVPNPSASTCW